MPMQAESLEVLEKADVPPAQARAIVRAIEIEIGGAKDTLATKHDVVLLRQDVDGLRQDVDGLRQDFGHLRQDVDGLRQDFGHLRQDFGGLRQDLYGKMSSLREEMAGMRGDLRGEIQSSASSVVRQMYTAVLGQMAVLLGFAYFFATHLR